MTSAAPTPLTMASAAPGSPSTPPQPSGSRLTPEMVYRPLSPTDIRSLDGDDDDVRRRWKYNLSLIPILRLVIVALTITAIVLWIAMADIRGQDSLVFLCVWLFFLLFWNTGLLAAGIYSTLKKGSSRIPVLPTIICQIGDWGCVLNADEAHGVDKVSHQKDKKIPLAWLVDIPFGIISIVVAAIGYPDEYYWYRIERQPAYALSLTVGSLEIIVGLLSILSIYGTLVFEGGVLFKKPTNAYQRIYLPDDDGHDDRRTAGISVSA
ncbi:hypothetical protein QBC43DRAFT_18096 [Cladorrhinum sp. PSN259]|nr:hypothetical protein QBC43DRAFT_18096 [Cladorrhinum sp. PSN259]